MTYASAASQAGWSQLAINFNDHLDNTNIRRASTASRRGGARGVGVGTPLHGKAKEGDVKGDRTLTRGSAERRYLCDMRLEGGLDWAEA